ncbi:MULTISPECIES: LysM domain-containing protein, partial [unclassified Acinetobacter]
MDNVYIVKNGDTLWGISNRYKIKLSELIEINKLYGRKQHLLQIGQKIYLKGTAKNIDTILTIKMFDLKWEAISNAKLLLEYDDHCYIVTSDDDGVIKNIQIEDSLKGIKISLYTVKNKFELIANHKTLPLGRKVIKLSSRAMVLKGRTLQQNGIPQIDTKTIEKKLKKTNQKRE